MQLVSYALLNRDPNAAVRARRTRPRDPPLLVSPLPSPSRPLRVIGSEVPEFDWVILQIESLSDLHLSAEVFAED